jgi:ADP-dependent NAD(P)H-hydrate dehydratase / NAD(P)H-hydrate epimerase
VTSPDAGLIDEITAAALLPERDPRGHKGSFGRLVAVAGSLPYAGAALMAGMAALRAGGGLVTLCLPASLQPVLAGRVPELMTHGLAETAPYEIDPVAAASEIAELPHDVLLIGPGLPPTAAVTRLVAAVLRSRGVPAVVDAGALAALATTPGWWERLGRPVVVTPHPGEFARLGREPGQEDDERRAAATAAAHEWGVVVVLKGAHTVVAAPDGRDLSAPFEVPALATGGTGDVLAGVIASLAGQGLAPFEAAALGVYLHARAGEDVSSHLGDAGLMATDLLAAIPRVRRHLSSVRRRQRAGRLGFEAPGGEA